MRNFKVILLAGILTILSSGCFKDETLSCLTVYNKSGEDLWLESNIISAYPHSKIYVYSPHQIERYGISEYSDSTLCFPLKDEYWACIAQTKWYNGTTIWPLSDCIYNKEEAYVRIYRTDSCGEKTLVRTWYYVDKDKDGHELFSESCTERLFATYEFGDFSVTYLFSILPEDITGQTDSLAQ